jgi:hypothetical protein
MDPLGGTVLQVADYALRGQARLCDAGADALGHSNAPVVRVESWSASAAAVEAAHAQIAAAGTRCASCLRSTASNLGAAATQFVENEDGSAAEFEALTAPRFR